ncbi:MAG: polyphosphate kinase 2 family protein [Acidobacteriota bacterium]
MHGYAVRPGSKIDLRAVDPSDKSFFDGDKSKGHEETASNGSKLADLQELLYAEHKQRILIVLQGMDTSGKDGTIRGVFQGVNPQGVRVYGFKAPSAEELSHDFLWRVHARVPASGEIAVFNRSHYEDILVVRVHELVPPDVWGKRYDQINAFEKMLTETGTTILKFFLHIDKDEQKKRLQARLDDPDKHWKFQLGDLAERKLWDLYMDAYQDVLTRTSTGWAPWTIVPANSKWYRNVIVSSIIVKALEDLKMTYPLSSESLEGVKID